MEGTESDIPAWASSLFSMVQQQLNGFEQRLANQQSSTNPAIPAMTPSTSQTTEATIPVGGIEPTEIRRKDRLPNVPEYEGRRSDFRAWRDQVNAKINIDLARENPTIQAWYIHSRLRGRALQQITPWVNTAVQQGALTPDGLLYQLQIAYDDPESAERAARKLNTLRQGTKSFNLFLAEFERTLLDAGGIDWSDQVKKTFLNNSLSSELQTAIIATPVPASYRDYCSLLQMVSYNLENLQNRKQFRPNKATQARPVDDTMEWEPTTVAVSAAIPITGAKRAKWVSQETLTYRQNNNLCLRCGRQGHRIKDCIVLPPIRPTREQTAAVDGPARKVVEDLSDNDSEKE